jgi:RNA polymerase sigma-70 factor (ECF subfamily)
LDDAPARRNTQLAGDLVEGVTSVSARPADDAELLEGLRNGDDAAFAQFVRQHYGRALATARRLLRDDAAAADCVQEAFLAASQNIAGFEGRSSLATWLNRITVNQALMYLRRRKAKNETPLDPLLPQFDDNLCRIEPALRVDRTVEDIVADAQLRGLITEGIDQLPDDYRVVLLLRDIEEMTTREVATTLDISEAAVKTRLHRARSALKKLLEPLWLEYGP